MKGDFTRTTFDAARHFSRVLMQQGRVTIDADANEQTDILLHYLRTLAADLIGPYAAPVVGGGFALGSDANGKLTIGSGRYYVDGILVENEESCLYSAQPYSPVPSDDALIAEMQDYTGKIFWVYLDVWERHVTHLDVPAIREVALGGPDTCSRAQVVWRVRARVTDSPESSGWSQATEAQRAKLEKAAEAIKAQLAKTTDPSEVKKLEAELAKINEALAKLPEKPAQAELGDLDCAEPLEDLVSGTAALAARVDPGYQSDDPCVLSPQAKYRGTENHLYRVEIHTPGDAGVATFKWSRDNGSVVTAWLGTEGNDLLVSSSRGFSAGCWVELIDDEKELLGLPGTLVKVAKVEGQTLSIDPASVTSSDALAWSETLVVAKVRRWDQVQNGDVILKDGAVPVVESTATKVEWLDLEDGIQIQFAPDGEYRTGDYWTIPARVATGSIEWPEDDAGEAAALTAFGIEHHYAPLGYVMWENKKLQIQSCGCSFAPQSSCYVAAGGSLGKDASAGDRPQPRRKPGSPLPVRRRQPSTPAGAGTPGEIKRKRRRRKPVP
jgi:hypothetical protein